MGVRLLTSVRGVGRMDGEVRHHTLADELLPDELADETGPLVGGKLPRKRQFDLTAELGVLPLLCLLDHVPEDLAIEDPGRRIRARGQDLGMDDVRLVEAEPAALGIVVKAFSGSVRGGGDGRPAGSSALPGSAAKGTGMHLESKVVDRQS
jgi:hypothetical protein